MAGAWVSGIWATPEISPAIYAQTGAGLFKRKGTGDWQEIRDPFSKDDPAEITEIVIDPKSPHTIHVAGRYKYLRSTDGGETWKDPVKAFQDPSPEFYGFALELSDAKTMYSGGVNPDKGEEFIFRSTDGGVKWKPSGKGMPEGDTVIALREAAPKTILALLKKSGIWRSTDGANSWVSVTPDIQEIRDLKISISDPATIFLASKSGVYRSTNTGISWSAVNTGLKNTDVQALAIVPGGEVFAGTFDGVYESKNNGDSWSSFNEGLSIPDVRSLAVAAGHLYAGTAGGSVYSADIP